MSDNNALQHCIDACNACANACDHCAIACLAETDVDVLRRCIALDLDCAQICRLSASMMSRGSEYASSVCRLCADICKICGDECGSHDMTHCQKCAEACLACAAACERMMTVAEPA